MNNSFRLLAGSLFFVILAAACSTDSRHADHQDSSEDTTFQSEGTSEEEKIRPEFKALLSAYPDLIVRVDDRYVILANGDSVIFDDGKEKDYIGRLDDSDVEDMFYDTYCLPDSAPQYLHDTGRSRSEALFKSMYGSSPKQVEANLVNVDWMGEKVKFTSVNGAADSLVAVARELADYPELKTYLKSSGTYYWRKVRGANRMSAHSYGIAFDIGVDKSDYWLWKSGDNDEMKKVEYSNRIPRQLVEIFQKHGFIWGGAWYHFDTMHFEFRPEILNYAKLSGSMTAR